MLLVYWSPRGNLLNFLCTISNMVLTQFNINLILGDFNVNALSGGSSQLEEDFNDYQLLVNFPTQMDSGSLDNLYIHKALSENFNWQVVKRYVYFSDHDIIKYIMTSKQQ